MDLSANTTLKKKKLYLPVNMRDTCTYATL